MSRKTHASFTRKMSPDRRFGSVLATKFINCMMTSGKKSTAENIFYDALDLVPKRLRDEENVNPIEVFNAALENVKPMLEVKSRRVGGANYQVPIEVRVERRQTLAIRWLIDAARARNERTMAERLCNELSDAYKKTGSAVKKRDDVHRMADANKAFAHYRW
jgi:small subunit ribosomal protein S7